MAPFGISRLTRTPRGIPREPRAPEEWQLAVDAAHFCLLIDSARQYGLLEGGPVFDLARCEDLLARGRAMGITPATHTFLVEE